MVVSGEHMTRIASVGLALALALISACGTVDPGGDGSHTGSNTGSNTEPDAGTVQEPGPGSVSPRAGGWDYGEVTPVSNTCRAGTPQGEDGKFAIDQVVPTSFRIIPNDGTSPFVCTWNRVGFSCPARLSFVADNRPAVDAVITGHATATGKFSDSGHGTGRQDAEIDCSGAQCGQIGSFPCDIAVDFAIHAL
jgi:hypothetical protein